MKLIATLAIVVTFLADTSNAAEPENAQRQSITGGALQYSLSIPAGWEIARNREHFDIFTTAKNSGGDYWLGVYALPDSKGDTDRWAELLTQGQFTGVFTRSKKLATIDSHQWAVLTGTIKPAGETLTCRIYAFSENGSAYAIMLVTTPTAWTWHGAELLNIAQSFKFPAK